MIDDREYATPRGVEHIAALCDGRRGERLKNWEPTVAIRPLNEAEIELILSAPVGKKMSGAKLRYPDGGYLAHVYVEKVPVFYPPEPDGLDWGDSARWEKKQSWTFEPDAEHPVQRGFGLRVFRGSGCGEAISGVDTSLSGFGND